MSHSATKGGAYSGAYDVTQGRFNMWHLYKYIRDKREDPRPREHYQAGVGIPAISSFSVMREVMSVGLNTRDQSVLKSFQLRWHRYYYLSTLFSAMR